MASSFEGRTAVVTGAAGGIGTAIAAKLGKMGASVALLDINRELVKEAADALSGEGLNALGIDCDVTKEDSVRSAFNQVRSHLGGIEMLINNAGIIRFESLEETTLDAYEHTMAVNARGPFLCCREVMAEMKERRRGKIVVIGSSSGKTGGANAQGVYGPSKAAAMTLAKSLAKELASFNVNVNGLAPSLIRTDMIQGIEAFVGRIPLGRVGEPDDVANAVAFLCSESSSYITGEIIDINGGFLID